MKLNKIIKSGVSYILIISFIGIFLLSFLGALEAWFITSVTAYIIYSLFLVNLFKASKTRKLTKINFAFVVSILLLSLSYLIITSFLVNHLSVDKKYIIIGVIFMLPFIMSFVVQFFYEKSRK